MISMRADRITKVLAAGLLAGAIASCDDPTRPTLVASLEPRIQLIRADSATRASLVLPLTEVRVRTIGPVGRVVSLTLQGGVWRGTVTGLSAGTYEVLVEGIASGQVQYYGRLPNITIARGERAQPTVTFAPAVPVVTNPPLNNTTSFSQRIPFAAIPQSTGYVIQYSQDNTFVNGVTELTSPDTNPLINVTAPGTWYIRSRAVLPQVPATSIPWSETRSWVVVQSDNGDNPSDGQPITLTPETEQRITERNLTPAKRDDWYDIDVEEGDSLLVETFAARLTPFPSALNTTLALFEDDGTTPVTQNLVVVNDVPGFTDSRLSYVAERNGTYKLRVGAVGSSTGHFELTTEIRRLPLAPDNLVATIVSGTEVTLSWNDRSDNETSFRIERCSGAGCTDFVEVGNAAPDAESFAQTSLTQGSTYRWRVRARNNVGNSVFTNVVLAALVGPAEPTNLTATTMSNTSIQLNWVDVANNETGYELQRCVVGSCTFSTIATLGADVQAHLDNTVAYNTSYQYQVRALNAVLPSAYTAAASANTIPPATPSNLVAEVAGPTSINLSWTSNSTDETHFLIERCLGDGCTGFTQIDSVGAGLSNYVSTVAFNSAYRFRVRARNAVISQTYSGIAAADTRPPAAPTGLTATTQGPTAIALLWTDVADDETGYLIERCESGPTCTDWATVTTVAAGIQGYTDNSVTVNNSYRYQVTAVGIPGNSAPTNIAAANTLVPAAPSGLAAQVITANIIRLTWTDNANNETGYDLARCVGNTCTNFASVKTFNAGVVTIDDSTATPGTIYNYVLYASNVSGLSDASNVAAVNTLPPSAPSGFVASLVSGSRIDLDWTNTDGSITGTRVERCTGVGCDNGSFAEITFVAAPGNAHDDFTVTAGNYYRYRLRAQNAADVSGYTAIVDVDARFMSAPTGVTANVSSAAPEITINWSPSTGPGLTGYEIQRCDAAGCTNFSHVDGVAAVQNTFTDATVAVGQQYRYLVRAVNMVGPGPFSDTVDVNTLVPATPTGVASELRPGIVRITWTDNADNETGSVVERCEGAGCGGFAPIGAPLAANATSFEDATAVAGTSYNYRVVTSNLLGAAPPSAAVAVTPFIPVAPTGLGATTASGTQINLTWTDNSLNEAGFEIRRCVGAGCSVFVAIDSVATNSVGYSDMTVTPGESYTYAVAAFAGFGTSNTSPEIVATTFLPNAPSDLVAQTLSNTSIRLTWTDNSDNETQFSVQKCAGVGCTVPGGNFVALPVNATEYIDNSLSANETYTYHIFATNTVGNSAVSNTATATTNLPAIPSGLDGSVIAANNVRLTWTDVATDELGYKIERCDGDPCTFSEIYLGVTADEAQFDDSGVNDGTTYSYRIRAYNAAGNSGYTAVFTMTAGEPAAPTIVSAVALSGSQIQVNWTDLSDNEDGFVVQRCQDAACTVVLSAEQAARNSEAFVDGSVTAGNEFYYRVFAYNGLANSTPSASAYVHTIAPDAPTALTATTFSATQVDLAWTDNGPYETGFEIQRCTGSDCSSFVAVDTAAANAEAYSDVGLTSGLTYLYRVRAINAIGQSAFTNVDSAATDLPAAPSDLTVTIDNPTDITLSWTDNADNEDEFFIERCEGVNCNTYAFLTVVGAGVTNYQDIGLTTGNTYRYRVQASNSAGVSPFAPFAEAAMVAPAMPTGFTATVVSGTQVDLSWTDASNNELTFVLERCGGTGCSNFAVLATEGANTVSFADAVELDSTYVYQIKAVNNVGASAYAAAVEVNTVRPDQPTDFAVTTFSSTQIDLSWTDASNNEGGFRIERCAGSGCNDFTLLLEVGADKDQYQDQSVVAQESYTYRITAYNVAGDRGAVGPATATTFVPALPTDVSGIAQSATQVNLSWTDVADNELGYRIERCAGGGCNSFVEVGTTGPGGTAFNNTGLVFNTVYRFRIRAYNAAGTSAYTPVLQVLTSVPANPSLLTATVLTVSEVELQFNDNSNNETGFAIQRCLGASCASFADLTTIAGSSPASAVGPVTYVDNTLSFGQVARYRVRSVNNVGNSSSFTNIAEGSTQVPDAPSAAVAHPQGQTQMFVQWSENATNEGGYVIERCAGETCTNFAPIDTVAANTASVIDATVSGGTFYRYRIRAIGNGTTSFGSSAYSNEALASTIIPADPSALTATAVSDNRVDLTWTNNAFNADDFRVFRCAGAACTPTDNIGTTTSGSITTYTDNTAVPNTVYRYSISATNGAGESGVSNIAEAETNVPGLPTNLVATVISAGEVQLTWDDNATTETGYEIYRCDTAGCTDFVLISTTLAEAETFSDLTVDPGMGYRYRIRATTGTLFSGYTLPVSASTAAPDAPTSPTLTPNATDLVLAWTDVAGETSYEVERCLGTDCTNFVTIATLPANSTGYSEAWTADTVYRYQVRAVNAAGESDYTAILTQSTYRPGAPTAFTATTATSSAVDLAWTAAAGTRDGYTLFRCEGSGCTPVEVLTLNAGLTSYRDEPLASGSEFTYDLRAFNLFGSGPLAGQATASTDFPAAPDGLSATTVSATQIDLEWNDLSGNETGFEIYRCEGGGCTPADLVTTTGADVEAFSDLTVVIGGVYRYQVRAINGAGASPPTTAVETNTQLPTDPGIVSVQPLSPTSIEITWTAQSNTSQYSVERCDTPGCSSYTPVASVPHPGTSFEDTPVLTGETYGYRVRGVNAVGASLPGTGVEVAMVTPAEVGPVSALPLSGTQIQVSWTNNSSNEVALIVQRCEAGGCGSNNFTTLDTLSAGTSVYVDGTVDPDKDWGYRVLAYNNVGVSTPSALAEARTSVPDAPFDLTAKIVAPGTIDLTWSLPTTNELSVAVERCSGGVCTNFTQIQTLPAGTTTYQDTGLPNNVVWRYQVRAINNVGPSDYSNIDQANTILPTVVTGLVTTAVNGQRIDLSWDNSGFEDEYVVERCLGVGCSSWASIATLPANTTGYVNNSGLDFNTAYSYRVFGRNTAGNGAPSDPVVGSTVLNAPTTVSAAVLNRTQVQVNWSYTPSMTQYVFQLLRCAGAGCDPNAGAVVVNNLPVGTTQYVDDVVQGVDLTYAVRAATLGGNSSATSAGRAARTPIELASGTAVTGISDVSGNLRNFAITVPADALGLRVRMTQGGGDSDLYVKFGSVPLISNSAISTPTECVPWMGPPDDEVCTFHSPTPGSWYVMMHAFSDYSGNQVKASLAERFGWAGPTVSNAAVSANYVLAQEIVITEPISVTHLGARFQALSGNAVFGIYNNTSALGFNQPFQLLRQVNVVSAVGVVEALVTELTLTPGTYWIATLSDGFGSYDSQGGTISNLRYYALPYAGGLQATWNSADFSTSYQPFAIWFRGFR